MEKTPKKRSNGTLVHDGVLWRLYERGVLCATVRGRAEEIPEDMLTACAGFTTLRVAFTGDVITLEEVCAAYGNFTRETARLGALAAAAVGREAAETVALPMAGAWRGHRGKCTLVAAYDRTQLEGVRDSLATYDIAFGGITSLELALFADWKHLGQERSSTLVMVGQENVFIVPATRVGNAGPQFVSAGLRHFAQDSAAWLTRLQRALGTAPGRVVVFAFERADELIAALRSAGIEDVVDTDTTKVMARTLARFARTRVQSLRAEFPMVEPYRTARRFSCGWLVAASLVAAAAVAANVLVRERLLETRRTELVQACGAYLSLEGQIKSAREARAAAERRVRATVALRDTLVARRKPLDLFVDVAYFYCRNIRATVVLESLVEDNGQIMVQGTFADPEDGVKMNEQLEAFLKARNLKQTACSVSDAEDAFGRTITRFTCGIAAGKEDAK